MSEPAGPAPPRPPCRCGLDLITLAEVAARLDVGESTVRRWHKRNGFPLVRLTPGHQYYALWSAVEALGARAPGAAV